MNRNKTHSPNDNPGGIFTPRAHRVRQVAAAALRPSSLRPSTEASLSRMECPCQIYLASPCNCTAPARYLPKFLGVSGTTSTSTGQYSYVPPCDPLDSIVSRSPSAHCPFYNPAGGNVNWVYEAYQYYSGSTVYNLPCGVASPNLVISPVSFVQGNYVTLSMTASPGDFDPSGGTPLATYYDQYGSVLGQLSVSSTSSDGSTVVFPSDPITNDSSLIGNFFVAVLNVSGDSWTPGGGGAGMIMVLSNATGGGGGDGGDGCTDACDVV